MPDPGPAHAPLTLAFDTSAAHCAAAVVQGDEVLARRVEEMGRGQAERLAPLIEETLAEAGAALRDAERIGVGTGPGNFTGIRISVALARGLALSLGRPAIGVTRFEALLEEAAPGPRPALIAINARRGQFSVRLFGADGAAVGAAAAGDVAGIVAAMRGRRPEIVIGAGAEIAEALGVAHRPCGGPEGDAPDPAALARLAARAAADGPRPAPVYMRPADAAPASETPPAIIA